MRASSISGTQSTGSPGAPSIRAFRSSPSARISRPRSSGSNSSRGRERGRRRICYVVAVNIACIGGGPAGLYLGILVKRRAPEHDVVVFERNRPADTFGFGVVFSDATLGHLADADPESHAEITSRFARWDDIEVHVGGEVLRSTGHGFCGIERKSLLQILQARAAALGVRVEAEREVRTEEDTPGLQ